MAAIRTRANLYAQKKRTAPQRPKHNHPTTALAIPKSAALLSVSEPRIHGFLAQSSPGCATPPLQIKKATVMLVVKTPRSTALM
jgi:hypothetical protein